MIIKADEVIFNTAIDSLKVVYDAEYLKARCSIWIAANTPVMTNKLDSNGNLVKNKITGEPEKEPLRDEDGNEIYIITMEEAEERLQKIKESVDNILELKKPDAKILAAKLAKMDPQTMKLIGQLITLPLAIISTTPVGPGFSPNLIKPIFTPVVTQAQDLSTMYDEVEKLQKDLQFTQETLTTLENINVSINDIDLPKDPKIAAKVTPRILDWITSVMAGKVIAITAIGAAVERIENISLLPCKTACTSVGLACGTVEKAPADPQPPSTDFVPTPEASECENYTEIKEEEEPSAKNCSMFEFIKEGEKPEEDKYTCQYCKNYKKA